MDGREFIQTRLEDCLNDDNSYGGTEAEIYGYRVLDVEPGIGWHERSDEDYARADQILKEEIDKFTDANFCTAIIVEEEEGAGEGSFKYYHRLHIIVKWRHNLVF